ncbi:YhcH/YjgK/YiaL family protein [Luxibacter massiliensis]|uniref:YhcH/YjgK/YiaL family protein n=1 Tax=Luxibacter massiliensis TaxID=2219695 RepID=UPI000F0629C7|nr:YhcH/YjgK/YiaL family protein [Luxibacter massiliensis]
MIYDSIKNKENYRKNVTLYKILCCLDELDPSAPSLDHTCFGDSSVHGNLVSLTTKPAKDCIFEAHKNFIDLHYILKGTEKIATADITALAVQTPYDADKDIGFYTGEKAGEYSLTQGDFMVCFPSDAHMVAIMNKEPEFVEKIVVKIKVQEI